MTERIVQKCARVREYLALLDTLRPDCPRRFATDPIYRGALLHYLYLMADTCIALAQAMIRQQGLRPPQSYHEAFDILGEAGVLAAEFAFDFARIAGFRNFLAHDYEQVEARMICDEILALLPSVEQYLRQIEEAARR